MRRTKVAVPDVAEAGPNCGQTRYARATCFTFPARSHVPLKAAHRWSAQNEYEQTRQIFSRIDRIIKAAGGTMDNLVKMTIYMVDIRNNTEVWRARREFFSGDFPASTLVEVRSLAKPEVLVEIEAVAWLGAS